MKSLVVAPQPFFTPRGTPMSVYYRALVMAKKGVEIDLLTYGEGQDVRIPGIRIIRVPKFAIFGHVKTGPSLLKMFLDVFIALWMIGLLTRNRYDFVHAHEESVFIAVALQPLFRFKLIYDMHSSLPEQLKNFGWSKSKMLQSLFARAEDSALHRADAVITICPVLADYAISRIGDSGKHFLIENSIFSPIEIDSESRSLDETIDVDGIFEEIKSTGAASTFLYAGTLETYQGIDLLLQSMVSVMRRNPLARLIVVGGSQQQVSYYEDMAKNLGVSEACLFFSRVSQATAKAFSARADVIVSPRTQGMNTPLKIYELLDSGKPLVATRITSHTQVLNDDVAFLSAPSSDEFAEQMIRAVSEADVAGDKITSAKRLYADQYAPSVYAEKIDRLLELVS